MLSNFIYSVCLPYTHSPVLIELGCASRYAGRVKPKNMENPRTKRFLDEFKSTSCRLERPTAVIIPEKHQHTSIIIPSTTCLCISTWQERVTHQTVYRTFLRGSDLAGRQTELWTSPLIPTETWCLLHTAPPACCPPANSQQSKHPSHGLTASKGQVEVTWLMTHNVVDGPVTLVIPRTPIFGLEDVEPFPVPKRPAMMQQTPSVKIPLK